MQAETKRTRTLAEFLRDCRAKDHQRWQEQAALAFNDEIEEKRRICVPPSRSMSGEIGSGVGKRRKMAANAAA